MSHNKKKNDQIQFLFFISSMVDNLVKPRAQRYYTREKLKFPNENMRIGLKPTTNKHYKK